MIGVGEVLSSRVEKRVCVVELVGESDLALVDEFRAALSEALEDAGGVIVDLSRATFVDSSILRALIGAHKRALAEDKAFVLQLGTAPIVERVLKLTGLDELLDRTYSRQEALARIRERMIGRAP